MEQVSENIAMFRTDQDERVVIEAGDTVIMNYENKDLQIPDQTALTVTGFGEYLGGLAVEFESEYFGSEEDPIEGRKEDHIIDTAFETMYKERSILLRPDT